MRSIPGAETFTNSGMLTARLLAVEFSMRMAGVSRPSGSICVRNICVSGERLLEENTSQRPLGEKLCQEFIRDVLHFMRRATPPLNGTIYNSLSGRISCPLRFLTKTIQRPLGDTLGKLLLMPLFDAPSMGSALPPSPPLKGT